MTQLRVTHVAKHVSEDSYPKRYEGMTLEEAIAYEHAQSTDQICESFTDGTAVIMETTVEVID